MMEKRTYTRSIRAYDVPEVSLVDQNGQDVVLPELLQSPEAEAVFSFNDTALEACGRIQDAFDATAARAAFEDVPWLPEEMKESIEVALGCTPTSDG